MTKLKVGDRVRLLSIKEIEDQDKRMLELMCGQHTPAAPLFKIGNIGTVVKIWINCNVVEVQFGMVLLVNDEMVEVLPDVEKT